MSDMHARKTLSTVTAVHATGWSAPPVAALPRNGFEPAGSERSGVKTLSWDELSRARDLDAETLNFKVPPELIEMARSNRPARGRVEVITPLAPRPTREVMVVVPPAPLALELDEALASDSAPPVALEDAEGFEPIITFEGDPELSFLPEVAPGTERYEPGAQASSHADEASPDSGLEPSRLRAYRPFFVGVALVVGYIALCYFANALLASLP
jgi:hypothetical protein